MQVKNYLRPLTVENFIRIMPAMNLIDRTERLLIRARAKGHTLTGIAEGSRGHVQIEWLKKFAHGKIPDPGVRRIQRLHDRLERLPLVNGGKK